MARTYNFLQKLSVPGMAIEDETPLRRDGPQSVRQRASVQEQKTGPPEMKKPGAIRAGFCIKSLAMTYSRMGKRHTTIGAERFHF